MLKEYGYVRVGAVSNNIEVGNVTYNLQEIENCLKEASDKGIEILAFPQLSLTGYSCQDLFFNDDLIKNSLNGIIELKNKSINYDLVFIIGAPLRVNTELYNCAISISKGKILGITPKTYIPNNNEVNETRYFASGNDLRDISVLIDGEEVLISNFLLYKCSNYDFVSYAIDIDQDLLVSNSVSNYTSAMGANIIFNLASSYEIVKRKEYRKDMVKAQASKTLSTYVYASSGVSDSSSYGCFSGYLIISEPNKIVKESNRFSFDSEMIYADVDLFRINSDRRRNTLYPSFGISVENNVSYFELTAKNNQLEKEYSKTPFLFDDDTYLEEILNIQTYALAKRVKHLNKAKLVLGISGGSDSTLAFLLCLRVIEVLKMNPQDIIAITMPGFGTSKRTYTNAIELMKKTGVTLKEISIVDACKQHYKDIGHDENDYDVTYENAQARERTQILFDVANDVNGIVIGSGDLSELVLGWATYNGDQMSNYGLNCSIPKTLVLSLINYLKNEMKDIKVKEVIEDILNTPITPELLPLDETGNIVQDSQKSVGPYKLHDFFIYHFLRYGASIKKLYYLACLIFKDEYSKDEIKATLTIFVKRFITQQFKRSALPDGVMVGSVGVCSKFNLCLPSDLSVSEYLTEVESL